LRPSAGDEDRPSEDDRRRWVFTCRRHRPARCWSGCCATSKDIHRSAEDWPRLRAVLERLVVLLPEAWEALRRERGLVQAALGSFEPAVADLEVYLRHCPDAADAAALRARIAELRRPPSGLVH
jgi:regulator of sirC expression with transglutaminase-like and TPR domain